MNKSNELVVIEQVLKNIAVSMNELKDLPFTSELTTVISELCSAFMSLLNLHTTLEEEENV